MKPTYVLSFPTGTPRRIRRSAFLVPFLAHLAACDLEPDEDNGFTEPDVHERVLGVTPNDPLFSLQKWHYDVARVPEAWTLSQGSSSVIIAVADSGRLNHPELIGKWTAGYDFYEGDADPRDPGDYHHGIHVAGTLGASANNGAGGAGICWHCPLMPIRVLQAGGDVYAGDPSQNDPLTLIFARAIRYAAGLQTDNGRGQTVQASKRADVVNVSIGNLAGPCPSHLKSAIDAAAAAGTVVVVSAGNGDTGYQDPPAADWNPANYLWTTCGSSNLIVVAAVDTAGNAEPYSLKGSGVTIAAPGGSAVNGKAGHGALIGCTDPKEPQGTGTHGVVSTWFPWGQNTPACYRHFAGTSMAAPHVSGVVGLMRSRNPALSVAQIKAILEKTAKKNIPCGTKCGAGVVDAYKAVQGATYSMTLHCESTGGGGFGCFPQVDGGVGPFTASWVAVQNASIGGSDPYSATGACVVNKAARVRLTLTDAIGRVMVKERTFNCTAIPI